VSGARASARARRQEGYARRGERRERRIVRGRREGRSTRDARRGRLAARPANARETSSEATPHLFREEAEERGDRGGEAKRAIYARCGDDAAHMLQRQKTQRGAHHARCARDASLIRETRTRYIETHACERPCTTRRRALDYCCHARTAIERGMPSRHRTLNEEAPC